MSEKIIRDPIHDVIALRMSDDAERLIFRLLNAAEFQRLRRIRQLGLAHLAYPGADHSRYSHSLGVMETCRKMLDRLALDVSIDPDARCVCLIAALLHDLGHGPFSHVFERVTGVKHEELTTRVILDPQSEIQQVLVEHSRELPARVCSMLSGAWPLQFMNDLISSTLDADRFDYLLRDNQMTGSRYGSFDLRWLVISLAIDPTTQRLCVLPKGLSAVESYLTARYHMYHNVYFHKVVRSGEGMLRLALRRARRLAVQDRLEWPPRESPIGRALQGRLLSIEDFVDLDDIALMACFKVWARSDEDVTLAGLSRGLLYRRLFKSVDVTRHPDARAAFVASAQAVLDAGGDPEYDLFFDEPTDTPYSFEPTAERGIRVLMPDGSTRDVAELSPMTEALNRQLGFSRIHVAQPYRKAVEQAIAS
jgi:hypothetical protein